MKHQHTPHSVSNLGGVLRDVMARVGRHTPARRLAPVPVPLRRPSGPPRWASSGRRAGWLPLVLGVLLLTARPAGAGALPAGVPDIYDAAVRAHFQPVAVGSLRGNPDLPAVLLVNTTGDQPQALLLGLDARNGKDTWSLTADPIILIVVFADATTLQGVYVDTGFAERGKASGDYTGVEERNLPALPDFLKPVSAAAKQTNI